MDMLFTLGPWTWLILGLVLIVLETLAPGVLFFWFGLAAFATAAVDWLFRLSWQSNLLVFAVLSVACGIVGWWFTRRRNEEIGDTPNLNRRTDALIGRTYLLDRAIIAGEGRIRVDDSVWRVSGPDLPAGAKVRVSRVDGANLFVEAAD